MTPLWKCWWAVRRVPSAVIAARPRIVRPRRVVAAAVSRPAKVLVCVAIGSSATLPAAPPLPPPAVVAPVASGPVLLTGPGLAFSHPGAVAGFVPVAATRVAPSAPRPASGHLSEPVPVPAPPGLGLLIAGLAALIHARRML